MDTLPLELIEHVASHLETPDAVRLSLVNRKLHGHQERIIASSVHDSVPRPIPPALSMVRGVVCSFCSPEDLRHTMHQLFEIYPRVARELCETAPVARALTHGGLWCNGCLVIRSCERNDLETARWAQRRFGVTRKQLLYCNKSVFSHLLTASAAEVMAWISETFPPIANLQSDAIEKAG